jgi:hypothetical protein
MPGIFVQVVLSGKVYGVNIVGFVIVASQDMISIFSLPPQSLWRKLISSHCPWVNNCVGVRTHRSFVTYVTLLEIGIPMFVYLAYLRTDLFCNLTNDQMFQEYPYLRRRNVRYFHWKYVNHSLLTHTQPSWRYGQQHN